MHFLDTSDGTNLERLKAPARVLVPGVIEETFLEESDMNLRKNITLLNTAAFVTFLWLSSGSLAMAETPNAGSGAGVDVVQVADGEGTKDFAKKYEQRAHADQKLQKFEGGGAGLYIGGSTAAIVLLVVILILVL